MVCWPYVEWCERIFTLEIKRCHNSVFSHQSLCQIFPCTVCWFKYAYVSEYPGVLYVWIIECKALGGFPTHCNYLPVLSKRPAAVFGKSPQQSNPFFFLDEWVEKDWLSASKNNAKPHRRLSSTPFHHQNLLCSARRRPAHLSNQMKV